MTQEKRFCLAQTACCAENGELTNSVTEIVMEYHFLTLLPPLWLTLKPMKINTP